MIDRLPQPSIPPAIEKSLDRRERRKFLGQQSPLTARCQQVQQGIDNFAFRWCAAAPASVASEGALRSVPIPHPSRRLHSEDYRDDTVVEWFRSTSCAPVSFGNQTDTQVAEITQFILGRTLRCAAQSCKSWSRPTVASAGLVVSSPALSPGKGTISRNTLSPVA